MLPPSLPSKAYLAVTVAALGYLVDIYDLILFTVVRIPSLTSLGLSGDELTTVGARLMNWQMIGMLIGGVLWGVVGDKRGRLSVLFGSILMYSLANIANGFVQDIETYAWLRLVAGIGLAGELGAGITLVSELLDAKQRGWATTLIAGIGVCGALLAVTVAEHFEWRDAYMIGGGLGIGLLVLRVGVLESGIFEKVRATGVSRGNFTMLFTRRKRAFKYFSIVLVGLPIWFAIGILVAFSRELGEDLGHGQSISPATAVFRAYLGLAIGDFAAGFLSQTIKSRKKALFAFAGLNIAAIVLYFTVGRLSPFWLYMAILLLGIANGYWAVFATVAAEQFGTNLRATAATTVPNFVRGSVPILTTSFLFLSGQMSKSQAAITVGLVVGVIAILGIFGLEETYGKDLDYIES